MIIKLLIVSAITAITYYSNYRFEQQEGQKDMENNRKELTGFYNDYYQMYINADPETREKAKQYNLDKHTENIISGRHDLIMFTAGKLIAIFKAEYDLATEGYQEGTTDND